jgi:APA family basic amino acid/polyamine antiporter
MVVASGLVSSAAIALGATAYLGNFTSLPPAVITVGIILILGFAAAWGILESVTVAAVFTVIEILGLGYLVYYAFSLKPDMFNDVGLLIPPFETGAWSGILSASLLAFFAFVGFEEIANVAEEVTEPRKTLPRAIILTLLIAACVYLLVVSVVVLVVPMDKLAVSAAPLALVFENAPASTLAGFNLVASLATLNGVLIPIIMTSQVLYGIAAQGSLHKKLAISFIRLREPLLPPPH